MVNDAWGRVETATTQRMRRSGRENWGGSSFAAVAGVVHWADVICQKGAWEVSDDVLD